MRQKSNLKSCEQESQREQSDEKQRYQSPPYQGCPNRQVNGPQDRNMTCLDHNNGDGILEKVAEGKGRFLKEATDN